MRSSAIPHGPKSLPPIEWRRSDIHLAAGLLWNWLVHALILRLQALVLPFQALVFKGH